VAKAAKLGPALPQEREMLVDQVASRIHTILFSRTRRVANAPPLQACKLRPKLRRAISA